MIHLFLALLIFLCFERPSYALFEKNLVYRQSDNRPIFLEEQVSRGRFYLGGGAGWMFGEVSDMRSFGMEEKYNLGIYNMEKAYSANAPEYGHTMKNVQNGFFVIGYAPKTGGLAGVLRHELEIGTGGYSKSLGHVSDSNRFLTDFTSVDYTVKQKYTMYNLYIQPSMSDNFSMFIGGGVGFGVTSISMTGTSSVTTAATADADSTTTVTQGVAITSAKNLISTVYSGFLGATYDISDSIVMQSKLKYMVYTAPTNTWSGGSLEKLPAYTNSNAESDANTLVKLYALEISVLFGL